MKATTVILVFILLSMVLVFLNYSSFAIAQEPNNTVTPASTPLSTIIPTIQSNVEQSNIPVNQENSFGKPDWSQFLPGLLLEVIGSVIFGVLVALILYLMINRRQERLEEKEAYRIVTKVIERTIAKLDYLSNWIEEIEKEIPISIASDQYYDKAPDRLTTSVEQMWAKYSEHEKIQKYLKFDDRLKLEQSLGNADALFLLLNNFQIGQLDARSPGSSLRLIDMLKIGKQKTLDELLPLYKKSLRKSGSQELNISQRRNNLQMELAQLDGDIREITFGEKIGNNLDVDYADIYIIGIEIKGSKKPRFDNEHYGILLKLSAIPPEDWGETVSLVSKYMISESRRGLEWRSPENPDNASQALLNGAYLQVESSIERFRSEYPYLLEALSIANKKYREHLEEVKKAELQKQLELQDEQSRVESLEDNLRQLATDLHLQSLVNQNTKYDARLHQTSFDRGNFRDEVN